MRLNTINSSKTMCTNCGTKVPLDMVARTQDRYRILCKACAQGVECPNCGRIVHNGFCVCLQETNPSNVLPYNATIPFEKRLLPGEPRDTICYGWEIESNINSRTNLESLLGRIDGYRGLILSVHDGTIGGMTEFVTQPMTLNFILANKGILKGLLDMIQHHNGTADIDGNVGGHIHVSREAFDSKSIYKIIKLIEDNNDFFIVVSGFKTIRLLQQARRLNTHAIYQLAKNKYDRDHHSWICLRNADTIEFRMFAGTLDIDKWILNTVLLEALILWANNTPNNDNTPESFFKYVDKELNRRPYTILRRIESVYNSLEA